MGVAKKRARYANDGRRRAYGAQPNRVLIP
jgi:hypothetical protein